MWNIYEAMQRRKEQVDAAIDPATQSTIETCTDTIIRDDGQVVRKVGVGYADFYRYMEERRRSRQEGKAPEFKLSCGACKACCYHDVEVDRNVEPPERLQHLDIVPDDLHGEKLRRKDDGSCGHLGEHGCTVYENRPSACRKYDCRVMGFFGINIDHGNGVIEPEWMFGEETREDQIIAAALAHLRTNYLGPTDDVSILTSMIRQFPAEKETFTRLFNEKIT
jgi:hypothetical protein